MYNDFNSKFVKQYADIITSAVKYIHEVKAVISSEEYTYVSRAIIIQRFELRLLESSTHEKQTVDWSHHGVSARRASSHQTC